MATVTIEFEQQSPNKHGCDLCWNILNL